MALAAVCACSRQPDPETLYRHIESTQRRGHVAEALEALRAMRNRPGPPGSAAWWRFQLLEAEILFDSGKTGEAGKLLEAAPAPSGGALEARYVLLGARVRYRSDPKAREQVQQMLDRARALAREAGSEAIEGRIELSASSSALSPAATDAHLERALEIGRKLGDRFVECSALCDIGYHRYMRGRFDQAIYWLEQSRSVAEANGFELLMARVLGNLGWCHRNLGDEERALDLYFRAEALCARIGDQDSRYRWLNNMAGVYMGRAERAKADEIYRRALELAQQADNRQWQGIIWNNIAENALESGKPASAREANQRALEIKTKLANPQSLAYSRFNAARILNAEGRTAEAERGFLDLVPAARKANAPAVEWRAQGELADLYRGRQHREEADRYYRAAISTIDREWSLLNRGEYKVTFLAPLIRFFQNYVDFLVSTGRADQALEAAAAAQARVLAERIGVPSRTVAEFEALSRRTGLVLASYWLAPERSFLWVITPRRRAHFTLPGAAEIESLAREYSSAIAAGDVPLERGNAPGRKLARVLLDPLREMSPRGSRVVLALDGALHQLSFETLVVDEANPHYWIEDVSIELAPSLNILKTSTRPQRATSLLLLGDPVQFDPAFPALPGAGREAAAILGLFAPGRRSAYLRERATPQAYRDAGAQRFDLIHFATHASANSGRPLESAVILSPSGHDYKLYAGEAMEIPLRAKLVTLSSCRSAGSRAYAGEGLVGFAWAFLQAGAENVIAGLWDLDDTAARETAPLLYRHLAAGETPARALRAAKLALLDGPGHLRRPYYWGPLQLYVRVAE
jgi:CHAT domain-containing protein